MVFDIVDQSFIVSDAELDITCIPTLGSYLALLTVLDIQCIDESSSNDSTHVIMSVLMHVDGFSHTINVKTVSNISYALSMVTVFLPHKSSHSSDRESTWHKPLESSVIDLTAMKEYQK